MKHLVFVIEDDENIRNLLCVALDNFGYLNEGFEMAEEALARIDEILKSGKDGAKALPAAFVFDWMLPGMDGMTAIKRLKETEATKSIPVLMLTAKDRETDIVAGLDGGADDYMTKPFGILELSARLRNLLGRKQESEQEETPSLEAGDVKIFKETREVLFCEEKIELTLKEFELLHYLMQHMNRVVTRDELLDHIWGYDYVGETRTLDMHIKTLRQKLKDGGQQIKTIRGVGYRFLKERS